MDKNNFINKENLEENLKSGLYLVATPIGNLRDISLRALDILSSVDLVACEDTRVTGKLLSYYGIKVKLCSYNDHSSEKQRNFILSKISNGEAVAVVSDAGMPLISDPGYKLVREAQKEDIYITSVPGANSPLTALQLSGLPSDKFCFLGFLPSKEAARRKILEKWKNIDASLIVFESGARLIDSLLDMHFVFGNRKCVVARELTKMFEEIKRGDIDSLAKYYSKNGAPKGEIVIIVDGVQAKEFSVQEIDEMLKNALKTMKVKEAATFVANETAISKKELYKRALAIKDE